MNTKLKFAVAGLGYVGISNAVLLAQHNDVTAIDIDAGRVKAINNRISPIVDPEVSDYLATKTLSLRATQDPQEAYKDADFIIVATPTNYDPSTNQFDTTSVEAVLKLVQAINPDAAIIIKSTVPVGYTARIRDALGNPNILF
jgi:UDPglucose 6-dehydrogenase